MNTARVEIPRDLRTATALITRRLRQARASTVVISNGTGQPPYSRIAFTQVQGTAVTYAQVNKSLFETVNGKTLKVLDNVQQVVFAFPMSDNIHLVSIGLTLQKQTYQGRAKALQMSVEKVEIMND
jgi:hypothetical protein